MNTGASTLASIVPAAAPLQQIIPAVLDEMNAALKARQIALSSEDQSDPASRALIVFGADIRGERHREMLKLSIDPKGAVHAQCGFYVMADIPTVADVSQLSAQELKNVLSQYVDWIDA